MKNNCNQQSLLKKSFSILHTIPLFVFIIFMLDLSIVGSYLNHVKIGMFFSTITVISTLIVQVYVASGIFATLIELIVGEEFVFTLRNFKKNAKQFWKSYLLIQLIPYILHFVLFMFFPNRSIPMNFVSSHIYIILLFLFANHVVKTKYLNQFNIEKKKIHLDIKEGLFILLLHFINMSFFYVPFVDIFHLDIIRVSILISKYFHFLSFIFIAGIIVRNYPELLSRYDYKKEVYLINPLGGGVFFGVAFSLSFAHPPVFVVLKALTPNDYHIRTFSRIFWRKRYYKSNVLVAITCHSTNSYEAYKIAKEFKKRGSKVVMGGPHVTFLPDEALEFCDSVVIGEAEGVWQEIIKDYENNTLKKKYFGQPLEDYYATVHKELLNSPPEIVTEFLETTRGCKYHCDFCTIYPLNQGRVRKKPVNEIVELIKKVKPQHKSIHFIDNNIYSDPAYAKKLFKALKPLNIKWQTAATVDIAKNEETLNLAIESGCNGLLVGYEIFGESMEERQGGKLGMARQYRDLTKKLKSKGINIKASFIFGFESDTYESIYKLWKFCRSIFPYTSTMSILTPLPGSKFYFDMLEQNRLINLNWRSYSMLNLVFKHKRMNNYFLSKCFPVISFLFLISTSVAGICMSIIFFMIIIFSLFFHV